MIVKHQDGRQVCNLWHLKYMTTEIARLLSMGCGLAIPVEPASLDQFSTF